VANAVATGEQPSACPPNSRGDGVREVAGGRARQRRPSELERLRAGDGDDAILERMRRVGGVELQPQLAHAECRRKTRRLDEGRQPGSEPLFGRSRHGQQRRVPPDRRRAGRDRLAGDGAALLGTVVDRVQRTEAVGTDADRI
jgi:hypothetical protein